MIMTTKEHLEFYNVSVPEARDFIVANFPDPAFILQTAKLFKITNQMLAEIYGGVSSNDVVAFFASAGMDSAILDQTIDTEKFSREEFSVDASSLKLISDAHVRALDSGNYWQHKSLTYSFNTSLPEYYSQYEVLTQWRPLSDAGQAVAKQAFDEIETLTQLTFKEVSSSKGSINFNTSLLSEDLGGYAYMPSSFPIGGEIFLSSQYNTPEDYKDGGAAANTLVHEVGHALGLKHPFETPNALNKIFDNSDYSIMSYTDVRTLVLDFEYKPSTSAISVVYGQGALSNSFGLFDVAALQAVYGVNLLHAIGNDTYSILFEDKEHLTIWDAGGLDTINVSTSVGDSRIDLRAGSLSSIDVKSIEEQIATTLSWLDSENAPDYTEWVNSVYNSNAKSIYTGENNLSIAYGTWIENVVTGAGDDVVRDNAVNNSINTGAGNDTVKLIDGGYDSVNGGLGYDVLQVDETSSQVTVTALGGGYTLIGEGFSAEIVGIETIAFSDMNMSLV
jgi:hypothetical protein